MTAHSYLQRFATVLTTVAILVLPATAAHSFSVLAHQAVVDQAWRNTLVPAIRKRFPNASEQDLNDARAYAHGGSHLPDLGYFPLGSRLFTDLLHYVRTGDFTRHLIADARTPQDYAFALGVLAHYTVDSIGHPQATNLAVPIIYPKLAKKFGRRATYADSPSAHLETEFRFDVLQVAHREQIPDLFEQSIEFKVPRDVLERAFQETYGLGLKDIFKDYDVALTTYRWGFRTLLNEATGIAWSLYREDIRSLEPRITRKQFVKKISRADFVKMFGSAFLEPGYLVRFVGFLGNVVPNVGPLKRLPFKPLPDRVQELYFRAFHDAFDEYVKEVELARIHSLRLSNLTLDTGRPSRAGEYAPADQAYLKLLRLHAADHFVRMPKSLARDMSHHFRDSNAALSFEDDQNKRQDDAQVVNEFKTWMQGL
jgi:hypothetical protein